ncbi:MAG: hypothetical protein Q9200_002896 [Gallowayella weberi]
MVVFKPSCPPEVIQVYSTIALTASLMSIFQHDFDIGSFAQFGDPSQVAHINDQTERTDFHNLPHFAIRERLDQAFILGEIEIDKIIPGQKVFTYDPHDPQKPPFTLGRDYTNKHLGRTLYLTHNINATDSELIYSTNPNITRFISTPPLPGCVALNPNAARLSGMLSGENGSMATWWSWYGAPPRTGDVLRLRTEYDWDSPRWPPPGVVGEFPGSTGKFSEAGGGGHSIGNHCPGGKASQKCVRRQRRRPGRLICPGAAAARLGASGKSAPG